MASSQKMSVQTTEGFLLKTLAGGVIKISALCRTADGNGVDCHLTSTKAPCDTCPTWTSTRSQRVQSSAQPMVYFRHHCMTQASHHYGFTVLCHNPNYWRTWLSLCPMKAQRRWPPTSPAVVWASRMSIHCLTTTPLQLQELFVSRMRNSTSALRRQRLFQMNIALWWKRWCMTLHLSTPAGSARASQTPN